MEKWSELPSDVVFLISDHLGVPDLLRFGAVCRSWYSTISEKRRRRSWSSQLQIPWLWFDTLEQGVEFDRLTTDCRFYSIKQKQQEETNCYYCIGSGYGWLVVTYETCKISLLNPITGHQIPLPHLSTYFDSLRILRHQMAANFRPEDFYTTGPEYSGDGDFVVSQYIGKAILTSPPPDCMVILMPSTMSRLAYARPGGDKTWTVTTVGSHPVHPNSDVICHNGQIYTPAPYGGIVSWDFTSQRKPTVVIKAEPTRFHDPWLVSSPWGDLLYVTTYQKLPFGPSSIPIMEVYKADFENRDLVKVVSLGQHAIFRVPHSTMCLPVTHLSHLQRDCIYFKNDCMDELLDRPQNSEIGVYDLEDGTMHFSKFFREWTMGSACMTWFLPSLA